MGSRGIASYNEPDKKPPTKKSMPTRFVQGFRELLTEARHALCTNGIRGPDGAQ